MTTTTTKRNISNVPHHPPHPSPTSQLASSTAGAHSYGPLHHDHLCKAAQSWQQKRRGNATGVLERHKLYSREAYRRGLVEDCALAMMERCSHRPDLRQCLTHPPRRIRRKSWVGLLIGGLLRRVGLRLQKTFRRLLSRLYWTRRRRKSGQQMPKANSAIQQLNLSVPTTPIQRVPVHSSSPSSPTSSCPSLSTMPPNLTPSPVCITDTLSSSPSREAPSLFAQFTSQGTPNVPGTLLTIAKRFEKLEKWTVGQVRAFEDRMNDVEKWLVDKELEKKRRGRNPNPSR